MAKDDRKHTAFVTVDSLYCYIVMPYGLLNALPTFARAMNITLGDLVRDKVEVYVDDIVVKTRESNSLLENLAQVFDKLRVTSTKLNPEKYVFGISAGKVLGFLVTHRGIEVNPDKIRAIEAMRPPHTSQGRAENNGVPRSPQSLHLEAGREGPPFLQADEGVRSIHMD
jgi:hypothetical protein